MENALYKMIQIMQLLMINSQLYLTFATLGGKCSISHEGRGSFLKRNLVMDSNLFHSIVVTNIISISRGKDGNKTSDCVVNYVDFVSSMLI